MRFTVANSQEAQTYARPRYPTCDSLSPQAWSAARGPPLIPVALSSLGDRIALTEGGSPRRSSILGHSDLRISRRPDRKLESRVA